MTKFVYYFKIWLLMSRNALLANIYQRFGFFIFLFGKLLRFGMFFVFLYFLVQGANTLAGYSVTETIFFFLTFTLVDVISQFLYREVYRFRPLVVSGGFDLVLVRPVNALFRSLLGGIDVIDFVTLPPLMYAVYLVGQSLNPQPVQVVLYIFLVLNGLLIATAFHILVISLGIITLEIDHTIMIYRDLVSLGRFPIDIYKEPLKGFLTYLIPVGIMVSAPAKVLMGLVSPVGVVSSFAIGLGLFLLAISFWQFALRFYTSASS